MQYKVKHVKFGRVGLDDAQGHTEYVQIGEPLGIEHGLQKVIDAHTSDGWTLLSMKDPIISGAVLNFILIFQHP